MASVSRIEYGPGADQYVEMSRVDDPRATVMLVHGGYWRESVTLTGLRPLAEHLVGRGFDVANVEYRRGPVAGAWPIVRDDVRAATAALRSWVRGPRLIGVGHSVGGELVLLAADLLDAVVGLAPVTDTARVHDEALGDDATLGYFGVPPREAPRAYRESSPLHCPPPRVPTLLVHGAPDDRVPLTHTLDYLNAHRKAPIDLVVDHGADHFDVIDPTHPLWRQVDAWLDGIAAPRSGSARVADAALGWPEKVLWGS
ncbi:alpha/beta hydrolase [Brooklawnia cerclae]|uniref:Acetyl esterase/lipase n=1 Tax=Brooklawnia cerclae TaxID=349934 RepID=A0ABX0SJ15_9ACTN|nr:alpha/beta hydrolase [Brooklawnia cerclae]NIH58383.1 acetyl esterase/lipase [Brooklawnia cerclae]